MAGPLEQFEIKTIMPLEVAGIDVSLTNSSAFMIAIVVVASLFLTLGARPAALVPGRWQLMVELCYDFVAKMLNDTAGSGSRKFFPLIFTIFMFVLTANLMGMVPYTFTVTSHIAVTFALAFFLLALITVVGFAKHGLGFLKLFVPSGVPFVMYFIITPIELISYLSRPISLSVRLFANMMAGHTMLKVFGGFVVSLGALGILPFVFIIALTGLEFVVALLQAYVFSILTCIYLNDALHLH